jgi:type IV fimbrial biogenesis protein FimT
MHAVFSYSATGGAPMPPLRADAETVATLSTAIKEAMNRLPFARPTLARRIRFHHTDQHGFGLIDLMMALTILLLLLGVAVPGYFNAVSRVHAIDARSAMTVSLFAAMRESLVHNRQVVLCPGTGMGCDGGQDWSRGWIAFLDRNGDRERGADEPVLQHQPALKDDVRLLSSIGRPRIVHQPNGSNAGSNVSFTLCDRRGPEDAVQLILANSGRLRVARAASGAALRCAAALK